MIGLMVLLVILSGIFYLLCEFTSALAGVIFLIVAVKLILKMGEKLFK